MLDGEGEIFGLSLEVEVRVAPSMKLGATPQCLSGTEVVSSFSGVVNDDDGQLKQTLEFTEVSQNGGDIGRRIFVDTVEAHEGVEEQEAWSQLLDCMPKPVLILASVEPERWSGDDLNVELGEAEIGDVTDPFEPAANNLKRILGCVEENASGAANGKMSKTRRAGSDGDGHIENEEALTGFGLAADDPDRLVGPQAFDEPSRSSGPSVELMSWLYGERECHQRDCANESEPAPRRRGEEEVWEAKVSMNSFSSMWGSSR